MKGNGSKEEENGEICVRLLLSKSNKTLLYAEAGEDFGDLLFSFLTIPLGYIIKEMFDDGAPSKGLGSIVQLYSSIKDIDGEKYFKSNGHKQILLDPKIAPGFGYINQLLLLGVEQVAHQQYYFEYNKLGRGIISTDKNYYTTSALTVKDPKSSYGGGGGFMEGPAMFTLTDDLTVEPISPV